MNRHRSIALYVLTLAVAGLLILTAPCDCAAEQERIISFDSHVRVTAEGELTVTETIRVAAAGDQIKRGIYRDFPTTYRNALGYPVKVGFEVLAVQRDGRSEPFHTEQLSNGVRVYIGDRDVFLEPGLYTYTLSYRCNRQIGFFKDYDELYWNVTGNDWAFAIEKARVAVDLPPGAEVLQHSAYTGPAGANGKDYTTVSGEGDLVLATTRVLRPGEGFTIAVAWPKGFVAEPTGAEKFGYLIDDMGGSLVTFVGIIILLIYYSAAWWKVGRDPARGVIIPRYAPPRGISPAAARFVMNMGFDNKALAVAVVSMAVKGFLTIREADDGVYSLEANGKSTSLLSSGETKVARQLFPTGKDTVTLKNTSHTKISATIKALRTSLSGEYEKLYFLRNTGYFLPGIALSVLTMAGTVLGGKMVPVAIFMLIWLSLWSIGVYALAAAVIAAWRSRHVAGAMSITLFALPFFGGEIFGICIFATAISVPSLVLLLGILATNILFYHLFKAPTLAGRRLMDEIEGLKLYLTVAEKERFNLLHPPDRTPEHFEALLPYAMALDVENEWNEQFADVLAAAGVDPATGGHRTPSWYSGSTPFSGLASSLGGSLAGAVAASSSAPGSSSGSGGGGSSGGGGGGGGGGGW